MSVGIEAPRGLLAVSPQVT